MKKIYLFILPFLITLCAYGQTTDEKLSYGVKAGGQVTANYGSGTRYYAVKPFIGFHAGIFAKYSLLDKISVQQEMLFTGRGIRSQYASNSRQQFGYPGIPYGYSSSFLSAEAPMQRAMTSQTDVYYLDLPLSVHYQILPAVNAHVGVMYSVYLFRTKLSNTYIQGDENLKEPDQNYLRPLYDRNDFERFEKNQLGVFIGGTYQFEFGLEAGIRYNLGLTRINKPVRASHDLQYSMIQVSVAYNLSKIF